jgi:aspartyl-tRNA(Asn)/glutamyl-tRNA(Gln) amidotransferase subunit A
MDELYTLDAWEIADRVRSGEITAKETLEHFLERIESHNGALNAFVHLDLERARKEAADIDSRIASNEEPGHFAGVPIGVKELEDVEGMPSTSGSLVFKDRIASRDSIQVARLREAGCVVLGKTAAPEFGAAAYTSTQIHGTTLNPWNLERTPGGSSGGSSAAVAAALVPIATGSDGGGSIRIPASYSGLLGFKGTFGRIPRGGSPDSSLTTVYGPMARSTRDAARYLDCVVGSDERDPLSLSHPGMSYEKAIRQSPGALRAVWSQDLGFGTCAQEVAAIVKKAADEFGATGAFEWTDRTIELKDPSGAWALLGAPATMVHLKDFWPDRAGDLGLRFAAGLKLAEERLDVHAMAKAVERRWENDQILAQLFEEADIIVTPTTSTVAFAASGPMPNEIDGRTIPEMHAITFTFPFNLSGHPAVSIPCGFDSQSLPVGLQIVGRRHSDHILLALAAAFERHRPWPKIATDFQ